MVDWAKAHNDVPMQVSAINKLANTLAFNAVQFPSVKSISAEAERLARQVEDKPGLVESWLVAADRYGGRRL